MMYFNKISQICCACTLLLLPIVMYAAEASSTATESALDVQTPGAVLFTPPKDWHMADSKDLPQSVKAMVVGKGNQNFPPSINLATESYSGTLKQYLKIVKSINDAKGSDWKDLGTIRTEAGDASLSQVDSKTQWGDIRMMHVMLLRNGTAYILTAASLKDEFSTFYKDFFNALRSLRINKNEFEMVSNEKKRNELIKFVDQLKSNWKSFTAQKIKTPQDVSEKASLQNLFSNSEFQEKYWKPFQAMLEKDYGDMNTGWIEYIQTKLHDELTQTKTNL